MCSPSSNERHARRALHLIARAPRLGVLFAISAYKVALSPWFHGSCRFTPSCSTYAYEAISRFGIVRGGWLAARRLARCHPFGASGLDPVPLDVTDRPAPHLPR